MRGLNCVYFCLVVHQDHHLYNTIMLCANRCEFDTVGFSPKVKLHLVAGLFQTLSPYGGGQNKRSLAVFFTPLNILHRVLGMHEEENKLFIGCVSSYGLFEAGSEFIQIIFFQQFYR